MGKRAKPKSYPDWYTFGWHGITFQVPSEWNLGKVTGDSRFGKSGYLRLDDFEISRVEVEWRPSGRKEPHISRFIGKYLDVLKKKAGQKKAGLKVKRNVRLIKDEEVLADKDYECFIWEADYRAYNIVWRCRECDRVVLLRVLSKMNENMAKVASTVIASLCDHPTDGLNLWGIYDLVCRVPADFILEDHSLKSGHLGLTFEKGKRSLKVDCVSLADILLKDCSLEEWFESFYKKPLRDLNRSYEGAELYGHQGIKITGTPKSRWRQLLKPLPFIGRRPRFFLDGRAWHCSDSNKIFVIQAFCKKRDDLSSEVVEVVCHKAEDAYQPGGYAEIATGQKRASKMGEKLPR